jgi:hypothetical protein
MMEDLGCPYFIQRTSSAPARLLAGDCERIREEKIRSKKRPEGINEHPYRPQWDAFVAKFQQNFTMSDEGEAPKHGDT